MSTQVKQSSVGFDVQAEWVARGLEVPPDLKEIRAASPRLKGLGESAWQRLVDQLPKAADGALGIKFKARLVIRGFEEGVR